MFRKGFVIFTGAIAYKISPLPQLLGSPGVRMSTQQKYVYTVLLIFSGYLLFATERLRMGYLFLWSGQTG